MKANTPILRLSSFSFLFLAIAIVGNCEAATTSTNEDLSALGKSVLQLLESRDSVTFAKEVAPSLEDWRKVSSKTNSAQAEDPLGASFQKHLKDEQKNLAMSAEIFIEKAAQLGINPARVRFQIKEIQATRSGTSRNPTIQGDGESLPWKSEITLVLTGKPLGAETNKVLTGEYEIALNGLLQFSDGWRCQQGILWKHFPESVADEKTQREMKILSLIEKRKPLHSADDPGVDALGKAMLHFLQTRDEIVFASDAMLNVNEMWDRLEKESVKRNVPMPSRKAFDKQYSSMTEKTLQSAREILATAERLELDFSKAKIKDTTANQIYNRGTAGTLDNVEANSFSFTFSLLSDEKSKSGRSIGGDYVLKTGEVLRMNENWKIQGALRWEKLPEGLLNTNDVAKLNFESYVAEHNALPPGSMVPEIEFVRLDNGAKEKLSDYRGKVLILDIWATWCGPCQEPMADLQKLRTENLGWGDRVKIMSLSIDDKAETVKAHLEKRGWTNTFNLWAGKGGWEAKPTKEFRVRGVPTTYIIDQNGKILQSGHPAAMQFKRIIDAALK